MIILNSMKILENLAEIEIIIQKVERLMEEKGIEADKKRILEALITSRMLEKN